MGELITFGGGGRTTQDLMHVTFEADENENITVVKGMRLSESVIDRMKDIWFLGGDAVNEEELKKRGTEELALEQARRETEADSSQPPM
uniref:Uncharacterized protein n=1 Tax=Chrysemys picta bellii TaxID=8478 RepID=A0A8C3HM41_CHRPI